MSHVLTAPSVAPTRGPALPQAATPTIGARALAAFPAGIANGEYGLPPEALVAIARGEGARLWDTEGREYVDFSMGWGSVLVGHANPVVAEAVRLQTRRGANFAYLNEPAPAR